ncbi:hypothetical protein [Streptomyces sp. BP-8]|uniref:Uncharacterized protein n=1 Tax=Streptomyces sirii TaxID=3127701 RepID=A0ABZ2QSG7_9ACTN
MLGTARDNCTTENADFNDVESDISYKVIRVQSRPMTEEEKVSRCGNASPS